MKFLSQLFEARGTGWTSSSFRRARFKLIALYLLIIASVIGLFAYLIVLQVREKINEQTLPPDSQIVMTAKDALRQATLLKPEQLVEETMYSVEDNMLLYKVVFDDNQEVEVDVLTGDVYLDEQTDELEQSTVFELLTDEIDEIIWWLGALVFLLASGGSIVVAHMTLRPISESVRRQKQFVSDAAHELRNPLASLHTTLESYIREKEKSPELSEQIAEDMLGEVKRLIATSEALLAFEKQETQKKNLISTSVQMAVNETAHRLEELLKAKNLTIISEIADTPIVVDKNDLSTVLYNLLHNAIKFSNPDTTINVKWNGIELLVTDQGKGIEASHLPFIFERFYKAEHARGFEEQSSGLGLALVREVVESYGNTIYVESSVGMGTTFTLVWRCE